MKTRTRKASFRIGVSPIGRSAETFILLAIVLLGIFFRTWFLDKRFLQSDESAYIYSSYALTRGVAPYRDIVLWHGPVMFLTYGVVGQLIRFNYYHMRLSNVLLYAVTVILTYLMVKGMLANRRESSLVALGCAAIYCLYFSYQTSFSIRLLLETLLTLFTLGGVVMYILSRRSDDHRFLLVSGFLLGCALMTTIRASFFIVALVLFHFIDVVRQRRRWNAFKDLGMVALGVAVPCVAVLVWVTLSFDALPQFITQTIYFHLVRYPQTAEGWFRHVSWYFGSMLPLVMLAVLGMIYSFKMAEGRGNALPLLSPFLYVFVLLSLTLGTPTTYMHYFFFLTPYLVFLTVLGGMQIRSWLSGAARSRVGVSLFLLVLGASIGQVLASGYRTVLPYCSKQKPYDAVHYEIASFISNVTSRDDRIWTSEGAIALFADRLIQPPNSTLFPFGPSFDYIFAHDHGEYRGSEMSTYKSGYLSIDQFVDSWEANGTKVVVFILGRDWVPYPDNLLWNGFLNQTGVSDYIRRNYELRREVTATSVGYEYQIWVRNDDEQEN